ncbi:unnamed protein product, partial [Mesorhabditis spiculigera]
MGVLTLNVLWRAADGETTKKTMQFDSKMLIYDVNQMIRDKLGLRDIKPQEYGLLRVDDRDETKSLWMDSGRPLEYYLVHNHDTVEYGKKTRLLKVRMLDGAIKTVGVDESQPVQQLMTTICGKIGISNSEEYSLVRETEKDSKARSMHNLRDIRDRAAEEQKKEKGLLSGTLGRKKEQKMEQLRQKLHTDEEIPWIDHNKTLREQGISIDETLLLKRRFFFSDTNVDSRDPVQLNLLYVQCRDGVLSGAHPVQRETALTLAALQCQIQYGDFPENKPKFVIDARDLLPKEYEKKRSEFEKEITQMYKELSGTGELDAKSRYVQMCRGLKTYGVTFFVVKEKVNGKNKLVPRLLGINKDSIMRVDEKTKDILKEWPLEQDFGDYQDGYYWVNTPEGERIAALLAGYIDIILKKRRTADHRGIEGDEGSTMLEDMVAPARATLVAHGQIGDGSHQQAVHGNVAVPGVLRSSATPTGYGINGAQYGAVSGQIISQSMPRGERVRVVESRDRAQRALVGTIEASIRAVDEAEEELQKEPEIELPKFPEDPNSRRWVEHQRDLGKENVNERLAAMGAATAQVVQWTAVQEEYDERVGSAIATIGGNLPEMGRDVRDLAALMPNERRGDLIDAARRLCGAFGDFLTSVNPEQEEKRTVILAAAGRVGDASHNMINTIDEPTSHETTFHSELVQKSKTVATSTAQLVLRAKTVAAECGENEQVQDRVIRSATQCAFATSQLPPRKYQPPSKTSSTSPTTPCKLYNVVIRRSATFTKPPAKSPQPSMTCSTMSRRPPKGQEQHGDEQWEHVLRSSNRLVTHQGPTQDLVKQSERVVRHSQLLVEDFERQATQHPEHKDRLLDAARKVASATSNMIDATKECEYRPNAVESQMAVRSAAENLLTATNEATADQQQQKTMQRLEQAARDTAYHATQTVTAANQVKEAPKEKRIRTEVTEELLVDDDHQVLVELIKNKTVTETLIVECTDTASQIQHVVPLIRESQEAQTPHQKFRAQSRLIRQAHHLVEPATRLTDVAQQAVVHVPEPHLANHLQASATQLHTQLAELRTAINNAQQLNFAQQLLYSEELIKELDEELKEVQRRAHADTLEVPRNLTHDGANAQLVNACRELGSNLAQLVSAASMRDRHHTGSSAVAAAQSLRGFTDSIRDSVATRGPELPVDQFIVSARSVVDQSGRIFDKAREEAPPQQLAEVAKQVSTSLRQVIGCLPDKQHIDRAVQQIRQVGASSVVREPDVRVAASRLVESASSLLVAARRPSHNESVNVFVHSYTDFHTAVIAAIREQPHMEQRALTIDQLENAREGAVDVLTRAAAASSNSDAANTQMLTQATKNLTETVNTLVESVSSEQPWQRECDAALRQIQSTIPIAEQAILPLNDDSYFASLEKVTEQARRLGEAMNSLARSTKHEDKQMFNQSVRQSADAVCSLAEAAAQSAYLVGVAHPRSVRGQAALIDGPKVNRSSTLVKQVCERIAQERYTQPEILNDATVVAKHTSQLAQLCRTASERTANVNVKKQFINCAREVASKTAELIQNVKELDKAPTAPTQQACTRSAAELHQSVEQLEAYVQNPEFVAKPATISPEGRDAQVPILGSTRSTLETSAQMIITANQLAASPRDQMMWQQLADNSRGVSDSIKRLVTAIRDAAPGQRELDTTLKRLDEMIRGVDRAMMEVQVNPGAKTTVEKRVQQQIMHYTQNLHDKVEPLRQVAINKSEELGHHAMEHLALTQPLVDSAIQAATATSNSNDQIKLFDQCRTVVEAEMQMMYACKNSAGNPKAKEAHQSLDEASQQYREALSDMRNTVNAISSEQGVTEGMVETISRSIVITDHVDSSYAAGGTFADAQTGMTRLLEEIRATASDMPYAEPVNLGAMSLNISEKFHQLAKECARAQALLPNIPDLATKLKVSVQKLGMSCTEVVIKAGQRRAHPADQRTKKELHEHSQEVVERVQEVLAVLNMERKGTQACINAANTVSGIIGDLDTTILFATSGSLNATDTLSFAQHRDQILKTAKALVEDTKALVAGAASNQEQLAVAAQNAVRTIVSLSDAVKNGAVALNNTNSETQVLALHAVRDVASALCALIQATKNANGCSHEDPAMGDLKEAAKTMVSNVTSLLKTVRSVENENQQGTRALEAAIDAINQELKQYDNSTEGPSQAAHPDELRRVGAHVTQATTKLATAASSLNQGDVIAASNMARTAVSGLLLTARSTAMNADSPEVRYRTMDAGRDVAVQVRDLLGCLYAIVEKKDPNARQALLNSARGVAKAVKDLTGCAELLKGDTWQGPSDPTAIAENELLGAASAIESAAVKLAELRPRPQPKVDDNLTFDEQILGAAKSVMNAVQTLVRAAGNAQRELVAQGRTNAQTPSGGEDFQWSEGLITAAKVVVAAVHQLCESANALVQGQASEEKLISAAKQVAASTARLLMACNVKADGDSQARSRLQTAGHAVKTATERLVNAARHAAAAEDERHFVISEKLVSGIAQVMDAQEEVLRKERELEAARVKLAEMNKARYKHQPSPDE